ncbi:MAG: class I SAM-dependent methyltransferase [Gammaproteobacteria bacterium]|nr:class I SAM-dependent methyltransferase [Gammaproteobacteria bacterium]
MPATRTAHCWPCNLPVSRYFLPGAAISAADEYADSDPYLVQDDGLAGFQQPRFETTLELVANALSRLPESAPPAVRMLDVACGAGNLTAAVAERFPRASLYGIDHSMTAVEQSVAAHPRLNFCCGDAYDLPYRDGWFDLVLLNNIWERVLDSLRLLAAVRRVLKPGGFVIVSTPSRYRFGNLVRVALGPPVLLMSRHHVTEYTVGQVLEQFRYAGMQAEVIDRPWSGPTYNPATFLAYKVASPVLTRLLRLLGSHHSLEQTVFYLARNSDTGNSGIRRTSP